MTNTADLSQPQGPLYPSTGRKHSDSEGLQIIHQDVSDAPQVFNPASEGLQSVDHDGRNGPQVVEQSSLSPELEYAQYGDADQGKSNPTMSTQQVALTRQRSRRRLIWAILIAASAAIAIAVGVGAGVGLTRQSNDDDHESVQETGSEDVSSSTDSAPSTNSPSRTTSPTASSTTSAIEESGVLSFSCSDQYTVLSSYGTNYTEDCGVFYQTNKNMIAPDPKYWLRNVPIGPDDQQSSAFKKFSFLDCINHCEEYNMGGGTPECYAVSFYANTTWAFGKWEGNCFLKNGLGEGQDFPLYGDPGWNFSLIASAYRSCLLEDEDGGNTC